MQQVAENVYRLGSSYHNFYLLTEGGKATVVDAGGSKELEKLEAGLASLRLKRDDVEAILLTHAHVPRLRQVLGSNSQGIRRAPARLGSSYLVANPPNVARLRRSTAGETANSSKPQLPQ